MTIIKSAEEIAIMRQAGRIVAIVLQKMSEAVKPGLRTVQLDEIAVKELGRWDTARASFKEVVRLMPETELGRAAYGYLELLK